jgi:hypothetical protein
MIKFGWLDYSKEDSSIIDNALSELEKKTVEQLGFSSVRNNFRAILFPGAAYPMTRLRYNYFVAYISNNLSILRQHFKKNSTEETQIAAEQKIRDILMKGYDRNGIFGKYEKKRVPHRTYWGNLHIYGFIDRQDFPSYGAYFFEVDANIKNELHSRKEEGEFIRERSMSFTLDKLSSSETTIINRLIHGKKTHDGDDPDVKFKLTPDESVHFANTIEKKFPDSLLTVFIKHRKELLFGKNAIMNTDDNQAIWQRIEEHYVLGDAYEKLSDDLKKKLVYAFIFNRLMGIAYNYYNAILYQHSDKSDVQETLTALKNDSVNMFSRNPYKDNIDEAIRFTSKWGSKGGHMFLKKIFQGLKENKDHRYFEKIIVEREKAAKTSAFALLFQEKFETGDYQPFLFGYNMNIEMVKKYLEDMEV